MRIILAFGRLAAACLLLGFASQIRAQTDEIQVYDATIAPSGTFDLTLHKGSPHFCFQK